MKITRDAFEKRAIKAYEEELNIPRGWWAADYYHVYGFDDIAVVRSGARASRWVVKHHGEIVARHLYRDGAIAVAKKFIGVGLGLDRDRLVARVARSLKRLGVAV